MTSKSFAKRIRRNIITMAANGGSSHVGSALSCADIVAVLYSDVLRLSPWDARDLFVLSKAHAAKALYAALAEVGVIEKKLLEGFFKDRGTLPGHLDRLTAPGIEVSSGALGHGFNIALGMALAAKRQKSPRKIFCLIGDGESQEGSIWEGALFAPTLGLDNFTVFIDYNNLQGYGRPKEICHFEPLDKKWKSFGWDVQSINGHDHNEIFSACKENTSGKPRCVIAHTTKGKGVSFMEDQLVWHYFLLNEAQKKQALDELA